MAIAPIGPTTIPSVSRPLSTPPADKASGASFGSLVEQFVGDVNAKQLQMDQAVQDLAVGKTENVHDVVLAVAQADLSFRLILEIRNRLTDAYQEIMRMQV